MTTEVTQDMIQSCAAQVERADIDRFKSAMTAPLKFRGDLMVLYAFNLEVARAPWVTKEPMIAEMRLQWWRDVVEGIDADKAPRAHEVATPLDALVRRACISCDDLDAMIAARRWDIYKDAFEDEAHFFSLPNRHWRQFDVGRRQSLGRAKNPRKSNSRFWLCQRLGAVVSSRTSTRRCWANSFC